jgi:hypothetical protein
MELKWISKREGEGWGLLVVRNVGHMGEMRELHTAAVPKVRFADPKGFATSSQGIRGYISVMAALNFFFIYQLDAKFLYSVMFVLY